MDGSIVFVRSHQGAPPSNTCFIGPIRVHNSNDRFSRYCTTHGRLFLYFTMDRLFPHQHCPFAWGIWTHLIHGSWAHPSPQPKRHLDRFSRFCTIFTDRQTDHCVTIGRIYVRTAMRPRNKFQCHMLHQRTYTYCQR